MGAVNLLAVGVAVVSIGIVVGVIFIVNWVRGLAYRFTGNLGENLSQAMLEQATKQAQIERDNTPASLSNMESVYLPQIQAKYPDLNVDDLRNNAGYALKEYLDSVSGGRATQGLSAIAAPSLVKMIGQVAGGQYANEPYVFHRAVISEFVNGKIRFEVAYKTDTQHKGMVDFAFMQKVAAEDMRPVDRCEGCGAVLTEEDNRKGKCPFCKRIFRVGSDLSWLAVGVSVR